MCELNEDDDDDAVVAVAVALSTAWHKINRAITVTAWANLWMYIEHTPIHTQWSTKVNLWTEEDEENFAIHTIHGAFCMYTTVALRPLIYRIDVDIHLNCHGMMPLNLLRQFSDRILCICIIGHSQLNFHAIKKCLNKHSKIAFYAIVNGNGE